MPESPEFEEALITAAVTGRSEMFPPMAPLTTEQLTETVAAMHRLREQIVDAHQRRISAELNSRPGMLHLVNEFAEHLQTPVESNPTLPVRVVPRSALNDTNSWWLPSSRVNNVVASHRVFSYRITKDALDSLLDPGKFCTFLREKLTASGFKIKRRFDVRIEKDLERTMYTLRFSQVRRAPRWNEGEEDALTCAIRSLVSPTTASMPEFVYPGEEE